MPSVAVVLCLGALVAVIVSWGVYLRSIVRVRVALKPVGHLAVQAGAIGLALAGISLARASGASLAVGLPAIVFAGLFLALYSQRRTPVGELRVAVGDRLLPFGATASDGTPFHTDDLVGQRVLLKFFRGHW